MSANASDAPWPPANAAVGAALAVAPADAAAALTPAQKRFNTLLARVAKLSDNLVLLEHLSVRHRSQHLSAMATLQRQEEAARKRLLLFLADCLQRDVALTAAHRRSATHIVLSLCESLAHLHDPQVQAVLQQNQNEEDVQAQAEEAQMQAQYAREAMETLLGRPLEGADDLHTAEAIFEAGLRQNQADRERFEEKRQARQAKKKASAKQSKEVQKAMDAHTALRTVYRQLASALHPDREPDEDERTRKTALMSEVNAAYDRQDLAALLRLQLQISQIDSASLSRLADDKLNAMCLLLKAQVQTLEQAQAQVQFDLRHDLGVPELDHISEQSLARALALRLHDKAGLVDMFEADLRCIQTPAELKRWLKVQARHIKEKRAAQAFVDDLLY